MDEPLACSGLKASPSFHQVSILLLQKAVGRENQTWAQNHFVAARRGYTLREHRRKQLELRMALGWVGVLPSRWFHKLCSTPSAIC